MRLLFWIASRNLASKPLKAGCAALGIALGVATLGAILVVDHNTVIGVREWHRRLSGTPDWELRIKDLSRTRAADALAALDGERRFGAVTPVLSSHALASRGSGKSSLIRFVALRPGNALPFDAYRVVEGKDMAAGESGVALLGETLALEAGLESPG